MSDDRTRKKILTPLIDRCRLKKAAIVAVAFEGEEPPGTLMDEVHQNLESEGFNSKIIKFSELGENPVARMTELKRSGIDILSILFDEQSLAGGNIDPLIALNLHRDTFVRMRICAVFWAPSDKFGLFSQYTSNFLDFRSRFVELDREGRELEFRHKSIVRKISILHMSDLYINGDSPDSADDFYKRSISRKMIEAVREHIEKQSSKIDFAAITGDIAFTGKENDYNAAASFLRKLQSMIGKKTRFFIVPGNHDVDRNKIKRFFSLHDVVLNSRTDEFLSAPDNLRNHIHPRFEQFKKFANSLNPSLYKSKAEYFWVRNFEEYRVSFIGFNSCWASENDNDKYRITLGRPQAEKALEWALMPNKIILMHHPFDWLNENDLSRYRHELLDQCSLLLHGHAHGERGVIMGSLFSLGLYPGVPGFQFIEIEFHENLSRMRIWPYKLEIRENVKFVPDSDRWKDQNGKPYYDVEIQRRDSGRSARLPEPLKIPEKYREWIKASDSSIEVSTIGFRRFRFYPSEIYVPLETKNPFYKPGEVREKAVGYAEKDSTRENSSKIEIESLLSSEDFIFLTGGPGTGKTTFVKHLAYTITQGICGPKLNKFLPVVVSLNDINEILEWSLGENKKFNFTDLLNKYLKNRRCPLPTATLSRFISHGRALFLLDGLDELAEPSRSEFIELIEEFRASTEPGKIVITSRPAAVSGKIEERLAAYRHEIEPLNREKIVALVGRWFQAVLGSSKRSSHEATEDIMRSLEHSERLHSLAENPLMLSAVCILYMDEKRIPENRAVLFEAIVNNMINRRSFGKGQKINIMTFLMSMAFKMQTRCVRSFEISEALVLLNRILKQKKGSKYESLELFSETVLKTGLLILGSMNEVSFVHLVFQEYLAARYMIENAIDFRDFIYDVRQQETIRLYIELFAQFSKSKGCEAIEQILAISASEPGERNRIWLLGAAALRDLRFSIGEEETYKKTREKMYKVMASGVELKQRFEAGAVVGDLGDIRLRENNIVQVKKGWFMMGTKEGFYDSKPQRKIYLDEYGISKYPVTNEEYEKFVSAGGYEKEEFWTASGWKWKSREGITEPSFMLDRKWSGRNFPVVGISWYEARAYAAWVSRETGRRYRLPTEAEWEKAARGSHGIEYPWGEEFNSDWCNSLECGLNRTSPIGIFPQGISPNGCYDMAGNVWEWCLDWYDAEYFTKAPEKNPQGPESGAQRSVRGGSWKVDAFECRTGFRNFAEPTLRDDDLGFRLVTSLP